MYEEDLALNNQHWFICQPKFISYDNTSYTKCASELHEHDI